MVRKSPVRHTRKAHSRKGNSVKTHSVGNGSAVNPTFVYPKNKGLKESQKREMRADADANTFNEMPFKSKVKGLKKGDFVDIDEKSRIFNLLQTGTRSWKIVRTGGKLIKVHNRFSGETKTVPRNDVRSIKRVTSRINI